MVSHLLMFPELAEPTPEVISMIELTIMCQNFNALPESGGLLDQDAETILKMQMVMVAQQAKAEFERNKPRPKSVGK